MKERRRGKIINVGSMAGHAARQIGGAYATSKAAILRYTKGLAVEVAPFGINANAVCPGAVWTPLQERGIAYRQSQDPELAARDPYEIFTANYARDDPSRETADRRGGRRVGSSSSRRAPPTASPGNACTWTAAPSSATDHGRG